MAGLVAALELARQGLDVTLVERADAPGGKMREVQVGGARLDAGPTVFTMRRVFEEIFADAGTSLDRHVTLRPVEILARHAWSDQTRLDLFPDLERSVAAIGAFAGPAEGRRYLQFSEQARRIYTSLEGPFMRAQRPGPLDLARGMGPRGLGGLLQIKPFVSMWRALGEYFHDPRLRQLFGRYATYVGSSPFLAPATLMLVAHAEREGVWLVDGGMHQLALALARLASERGVQLRHGVAATEIQIAGGRVSGVRLATGESLPAAALVFNGDVSALATGHLGPEVRGAVPATPPAERSLSALTWALLAPTEGFPLLRHTVFFSDDYAAEFADIFERGRLPTGPTVYLCAQDRDDRDQPLAGPERLLCLVNAPPKGDTHLFDAAEIKQCEERTFALLERCGLRVRRHPDTTRVTSPTDFNRLFPATGGALYGQVSHGWRASFTRPGSRTKLPGLYLAGGSTHPGAGVPMAALSGRLAAACLLTDLASTSRSSRVAMPGGTSTP